MANDEVLNELAMQIRDQILADATDRRGWRQEWGQFDNDARDEVRETWRKMIFNRLRDHRDGVQ